MLVTASAVDLTSRNRNVIFMGTKNQTPSQAEPRSSARPVALASDLDGTFIPLPGRDDNREALRVLHEQRSRAPFILIFATGRRLQTVEGAIVEHGLPEPDWLVCDVGTSIYERVGAGWSALATYEERVAEVVTGKDRGDVERALAGLTDLTLQDVVHQKRFKISYDAPATRAEELSLMISSRLHEHDLPYEVTASVDPSGAHGLIDVLPRGVGKAFALKWLCEHLKLEGTQMLYAGDSGNDLDALSSGFRAIVVGNATPGLVEQAREKLAARGSKDCLFVATGSATSGVVEGCRHWGLF
jgi:HAD superfamily hydrolase (TIGR01484 family)